MPVFDLPLMPKAGFIWLIENIGGIIISSLAPATTTAVGLCAAGVAGLCGKVMRRSGWVRPAGAPLTLGVGVGMVWTTRTRSAGYRAQRAHRVAAARVARQF